MKKLIVLIVLLSVLFISCAYRSPCIEKTESLCKQNNYNCVVILGQVDFMSHVEAYQLTKNKELEPLSKNPQSFSRIYPYSDSQTYCTYNQFKCLILEPYKRKHQ